ncbi:MAG TPA: prepilin-type N-terminal cleavage/methylation domain-containing protein [Bdellovibrionota bacterium]|nr:prepilin-type N-terminal cleavage/methylation domain-containing protein [Bdellovibrionota bacterium]
MRNASPSAGFSLTEILIGLLLMSILSVFVYRFTGRATKVSAESSAAAETKARSQQVADQLDKILRPMERPSAGHPIRVSSTSIAFPRRTKTIEVRHVPQLNQIRQIETEGNNQQSHALADRVRTLTFKYLDRDGKAISTFPTSDIESLTGTTLENMEQIQFNFLMGNDSVGRTVRLRNYGLNATPTP